jgi:hypothetical protein
MRLAGTLAVNKVGVQYNVVRAVPLQKTTESRINPLPFIVSATSEAPAETLSGRSTKICGGGGRTVRVAVRVAPFADPVIVTSTALVTAVVVMLNVMLLCPAGMVTLAGTGAVPGLLLERATDTGFMAGVSRLTVPVAVCPPVTVCGLMVSEESGWAGSIVRVTPPVLPIPLM